MQPLQRQFLVATLLFAIVSAAWFALTPGFGGPFVLDDRANLSPLGAYGGADTIEGFKRFVFGGGAGPYGRPISLATFAANAQDWPADPYWFKVTNVGIHLLVGLVMFLLGRAILRCKGMEESQATWLGMLACALWLLHPMQSSLVLYVIQRMAQLSALFIALGALGWLHGRNLLNAGHVFAGYVWMSLSLLGFGTLGMFSKENAAVLPLLVLAMVVTVAPVAQERRTWLWWGWCAAFICVPVGKILQVHLGHIGIEGDFVGRSFGPGDRLSTQAVVLWHYLMRILVWPEAAPSMFTDHWNDIAAVGFGVQQLLAISVWTAAIVLAWCIRRRLPVLALALFGFLALHALEAGPVSLEVYFLHRNYLAMFFPILAVVALVGEVPGRYRAIPSCALVVVLFVFAAMLHSGAQYWGSEGRLMSHWAQQSPKSLRAQHYAMMHFFMRGDYARAEEHLKLAREHHPQSSQVAIQSFLLACFTGRPVAPHLQAILHRAHSDEYTNATRSGLRILDLVVVNEDCVDARDVPIYETIAAFRGNPNYRARHVQATLYKVEYDVRMRRGDLTGALQAANGRLRFENTAAAWRAKAEVLGALGHDAAAERARDRASVQPRYTGLGKWLELE